MPTVTPPSPKPSPALLRQHSEERKLVEVQRLLRKSTLNDHITISPLGPQDERMSTKKVETIKLRASFEGFSPPASPQQVSRWSDSTGVTPPTPSPQTPGAARSPQEIFVRLPRAELVEIQPRDAGWFAVLTVDKQTKEAIEAFVSTGRRRFKETRLNAGYISPFSDPLPHELRAGAHARVAFQMSEYLGKMLHSSFLSPDGELLFGPGDELLDVHQKPPLGPCSAVVHMMGYWYDRTKQGPLLYLTEVGMLTRIPNVSPVQPTLEAVQPRSPAGSPNRIVAIKAMAEDLARNPSPPAGEQLTRPSADSNIPRSWGRLPLVQSAASPVASPGTRRQRRMGKEVLFSEVEHIHLQDREGTGAPPPLVKIPDAITPPSSPPCSPRKVVEDARRSKTLKALATISRSPPTRRGLSCATPEAGLVDTEPTARV